MDVWRDVDIDADVEILELRIVTDPPKPLWNDPVAMGTRSPILREAFSLSRTRISGLCRTLVSLSLASSENDIPGIETEKSPALSEVKEFSVSPEPELEPEELDELPPGARVTEALVGGLVPMVRVLFLLTSITMTSMTTSALGLSMSVSSFWARTIWSGVPRKVSERCSGVTWMRLISRMAFRVPAACCRSAGEAAFLR